MIQFSRRKMTTARLIVVISLLVAGLALFLSIYFSVAHNSGFTSLDQPALQWMISHRTPLLTTTMEILTNIMSPVGFVSIITISAIIWAKRSQEIWRPSLLMGAMIAATLLSVTIKNIVERTRPPLDLMVAPFELDFAFPSGHTIGIAVCFFVASYLVYSRRRTTKTLLTWTTLTIIAVITVAFSRVYLGYHWITDVSASVGLALIVLSFIVTIDTFEPKKRLASTSLNNGR